LDDQPPDIAEETDGQPILHNLTLDAEV
jgi:hypothetical protein